MTVTSDPAEAVPADGGIPTGRTAVEAAVLDAAAASLLAVGVRRTTLTDVARRAGVSRMTLYRRWPDLRTLVGDVMTREWSRVVTTAAGRAAPSVAAGTRAGLVDNLVTTVQTFRANPLFRKMVDTDPELLMPYVLDRLGATQRLVLDLLEDQLTTASAAGSVRSGDPATQARMVLLTVQSFVLSAGAMTTGADSDDVTEGSLTEELRRMLDGYLAPPDTSDTSDTSAAPARPAVTAADRP